MYAEEIRGRERVGPEKERGEGNIARRKKERKREWNTECKNNEKR